MERSGDRDHPGQHGETLSLLKYKKLAGRGSVRLLSQLLGRLRQENHLNPGGGSCGELRSCHCTPAWATEQDCVSKKKMILHHLKKKSALPLHLFFSRQALLLLKTGQIFLWMTPTFGKSGPKRLT